MQSKPPTAGLCGDDNMPDALELMGLFNTLNSGKKDTSCFERLYPGYGKRGLKKVKQG